MTSSSYEKGAQFERRVRDDLEHRGYIVLKSGGSRTPVDLVAMRPGELLLVQARRTGRLDPAGWNALHDTAQAAGGVALLAYNGIDTTDKRRSPVNYRRLTQRKRETMS